MLSLVTPHAANHPSRFNDLKSAMSTSSVISQIDSISHNFGHEVVAKVHGEIYYIGNGKRAYFYVASKSGNPKKEVAGEEFITKTSEDCRTQEYKNSGPEYSPSR